MQNNNCCSLYGWIKELTQYRFLLSALPTGPCRLAAALDYESSGDYGQALKYFDKAKESSGLTHLAVCGWEGKWGRGDGRFEGEA